MSGDDEHTRRGILLKWQQAAEQHCMAAQAPCAVMRKPGSMQKTRHSSVSRVSGCEGSCSFGNSLVAINLCRVALHCETEMRDVERE